MSGHDRPSIGQLGLIVGLERHATALETAAERLGVRAQTCTLERLRAEALRCVTRSERSLAATGVPSVAEAAALAGTGPGGALIQPRAVFGAVSVALAAATTGGAP